MDLQQVTLTQMRYAVAVAESGNFRVAAEKVHVSQSGLSMQIKKLEELLSVILFDRSKKPVLVTEEGERVLAQIRSILRELTQLGQVARDEDEIHGAYRLGVIPSMSASLIPLLLPEFIQLFPRVELTITETKTADMIEQLQAGTLDGGLCATPLGSPGIFESSLAEESFCAYLPPGVALSAKTRLSQKDLAELPLWVMPEGHCFRTQVLSYCQAERPRSPSGVEFESGSFETLIRLVDGGMGATVLPELIAQRLPPRRQSEQVRPLTGPRPVREIGLVTARRDYRRRVTSGLEDIARRKLRELLGTKRGKLEVLLPRA